VAAIDRSLIKVSFNGVDFYTRPTEMSLSIEDLGVRMLPDADSLTNLIKTNVPTEMTLTIQGHYIADRYFAPKRRRGRLAKKIDKAVLRFLWS